MRFQSGNKVFPRKPISQNVVHSLKVERLLDFGVGGKVEMDQDQEWNEGGKEKIYQACQRCSIICPGDWL